MIRALLTGSTGRLGSAFASLWANDPDVTVRPLTRDDADLSQPDTLREILREHDFDTLINPAAVSGLEECLDQPELAHAVNVQAPTVMAEICQEKCARFIHISTDYVFDGLTPGKKSETDPTSPINPAGAV